MEDDITASVVLPRESLNDLDPRIRQSQREAGARIARRLLFQRPDDAIHRGADKQAEADIASPGTFLSNYEPIHPRAGAQRWWITWPNSIKYTEPMKHLLQDFVRAARTGYVVSSAHPRMVNGKPSTNPRYLQKRPDLENPRETYLAEIAARLEREIPAGRSRFIFR